MGTSKDSVDVSRVMSDEFVRIKEDGRLVYKKKDGTVFTFNPAFYTLDTLPLMGREK